MGAQLFDSSNISSLPWPNTPFSRMVKSILIPFIKNSPSNYIENVETTLLALLVDDCVLPITVNSGQYQNSYVCSPYGHFVEYSKDQLLGKSKKILSPLIDFYGSFYKLCKFNRVVIVNNWLLSTILYPDLQSNQIREIKEFLIKKFPNHAIVFRCINDFQLPKLSKMLREEKFSFIPSRIVFFSRGDDEKTFTSRMHKSDIALIKQSSYQVGSLKLDDSKHAAQLYAKLNIEKHSRLNPQFNSDFVRLAIENNLLRFKTLKTNDRLDGVVGYYATDSVMTCPFFGYDTDVDAKLKVYRQLSTHLLLESKELNLLFHQSSGAGMFKKLRRAESTVEYYAVYTKHLPFYQRAPWSFLKQMMQLFGLRIMEKIC